MNRVWLVLLVGLSWLAAPAHADRDIVYAARYYLPPGNHRTSCFHLYRVNADGTGRTQITFGSDDDSEPVWSPDGNQILFMRDGRGLCLVRTNGGAIQTLVAYSHAESDAWGPARWMPDGKTVTIGHTDQLKAGTTSEVLKIDIRTRKTDRIAGAFDVRVAPDGKHAFLPGDTSYRVQDRLTREFVRLTDPLHGAAWVNNETLIGVIRDPATDLDFLRFVGLDGRQAGRQELQFPPAFDGSGMDDPHLRGGTVLQGPHGLLIYALNNHDSTVGLDYLFFRLPTDGTTVTYLREGQFLAWSPDGAQFCTAPGRDLTEYNGNHSVWTAPLFVRAAGGGAMRQITQRLCWVTGADWRRRAITSAER